MKVFYIPAIWIGKLNLPALMEVAVVSQKEASLPLNNVYHSEAIVEGDDPPFQSSGIVRLIPLDTGSSSRSLHSCFAEGSLLRESAPKVSDLLQRGRSTSSAPREIESSLLCHSPGPGLGLMDGHFPLFWSFHDMMPNSSLSDASA